MSSSQAPGGERKYLLSPEFLRKLEQAGIASREIMLGRTKGERRSARRGSSVEFADFRAYVPGDDLRYLDWNAFARLRRVFLKLFVEEEDLHIYLLLDTSRSMGFGSPTKFEWAKRSAAALAYIALCGGDRVQVFAHSQADAKQSRMVRGRGAAPELFEWLGDVSPDGGTGLPGAVRWMQTMLPAPGITFVISDLLAPDWEAALARLAASKGEVCVLQVFSREEVAPTARGDLRLVDSETAQDREITMGASVLRKYEEERDGFLAAVQQACGRYSFSHLFAVSDEPVEDVILKSLRRLQVIR